MPKTLNKVILIGRLGKEPEMVFSSSGIAIGTLSVATDYRKKDGDEWKDETEWNTVKVFDKKAEYCSEHMGKGSLVYVEGRLQTRKWDKDGETRYVAEIIAHQVMNLSKNKNSSQETADKADEIREKLDNPDTNPDDLPF